MQTVSPLAPKPDSMNSPRQSEPVKTVLFSSLCPNSDLPRAGVFVETRLRELISTCRVHAKVVAPVRIADAS